MGYLRFCGCLAFALFGELSLSNAAPPIPPMQSAPWTLTVTNPIPNLESAVSNLFACGMADPRGCDYREIEIVVGNFGTATGATNKTHGWVLPFSTNSQTGYAIGWNGLIYPVVTIGNKANAEEDARHLIQAIQPPSIPNKTIFEVGVQAYADESYSLNVQWLTPAKAAMIFRFGSPELVAQCAQLFPAKDPFLALSTGFLWDALNQAVGAHMQGNDELAYSAVLNLESARVHCEAQAKARGFALQETPSGPGLHSVSEQPKRELYYPFLRTFPPLLHDQELRHARQTQQHLLIIPTDKTERIEALIDQLQNASARQVNQYYADNDLANNPAVLALIAEGWDAVGPLLHCYEQDQRLTRIIPTSHFDWPPNLAMVQVRSAAYVALERIIETTQFAPQFSREDTAEIREQKYQASAKGIREYWNKYQSLNRAERLYAILKDDHGQWLEAATIIVQATNDPALTESLRTKTSPSITELLSQRIQGTLTSGSHNGDDAGFLNGACDLAFCLGRWNPEVALNTYQNLCALSFKVLSPTNYSSLCSHHTLAGQLSEMIQSRANMGDTNALRDYAQWLESIEPEQNFSDQIGNMLEPLIKCPAASAWKKTWPMLFEDTHSPWFQYLLKENTPDPKRMRSPALNMEVYFDTPAINNLSFRKFVIRLLQVQLPCGKIVGDPVHGYWLDQQFSTHRRFGFTVDVPADKKEINGIAFRACDFYAWLLSNRVETMPAFQLYWPEAEKDKAIARMMVLLQNNQSAFKTHSFQRP